MERIATTFQQQKMNEEKNKKPFSLLFMIKTFFSDRCFSVQETANIFLSTWKNNKFFAKNSRKISSAIELCFLKAQFVIKFQWSSMDKCSICWLSWVATVVFSMRLRHAVAVNARWKRQSQRSFTQVIPKWSRKKFVST